MNFTLENNFKILQALVDVTNYLAERDFTYDETSEFINVLNDEISTSRTCYEYETAEDWVNRKPCYEIGKKVIAPLNKVDVKEVMLKDIDKLVKEVVNLINKTSN